MTKRKNLLIVLISALFILLTCAFGSIQKNMKVSAGAMSTNGEIIGASIRYDENNTNQSGIRFAYVINKTASGITDGKAIKNAGILSSLTGTFTGELTTENATINTAFYADGVVSEQNKINVGTYDATKKEFIKSDDGDDLLLLIYFYNIPLATDKATEITCRGYLQLADGELVYSNALDRSIEYVATKAYQEGVYGNDDNYKSFLASCCTFYNITFVNGSETVATQNVIKGEAIEPPTTTLDGYTFIAWTKADGTLVDQNTVITEDTTVYANFKKTVVDDTIYYATDDTVEWDGVSACTKVSVGDTVLDGSAYSFEGTTLSVNTSVLGHGENAIKVYESDYVYTEYTKTVIDSTKPLAFTSLDASHVVGGQMGDATKTAATEFVNEVNGESGSFVKVTVGGDITRLALKVDSIYGKEVWEKYKGGTLKIDYYIDCDGYTSNDGIGLLATADNTWADTITDTSMLTGNKWHTAEIPVDTIVKNWEYFEGYTGTNNIINTISWKGALMYFINGFTGKSGAVYFRDFTVTPFDISIPRKFTSLDKSHILGAHYGTAKENCTSIVTETVGERTGTFVKVEVGGDIKALGLKVAPTIDKATLEAYKGGKIAVNYYIDVNGAYTGKVSVIATGADTYAETRTGSVSAKEWQTVEISVDVLLEHWDFFTGKTITAVDYASILLRFYGFSTLTGYVYFDGFDLIAPTNA